MFRIRFHGRGGLGMRVASRILGDAFFAQGYEVQDAPRYGAERRGAPVFAYVRAAHRRIDERGVVLHPDLLVVADDTLVPVPAAAVLQGVTKHTVVLIRTALSAEVWRDRLKLSGPIVALPAGGEPTGAQDLSHVGASCAGAAACLVGTIRREALAEAVRAEVAPFGAAAAETSIADALAAYDALAPHAGIVHESGPADATRYAPPSWVYLHPESADVSAPDVRATGTSVLSPTGLWRTMRPVIDMALCNRCSWICSTYCPDGAIAVEADRTPRIDYEHCKGCLVCVAVCPPHAISAVPERVAAGEPS